MADALMKYETIDSSQIDQIMEGKAPDPPADWTDGDQGLSSKKDATAPSSEDDGTEEGDDRTTVGDPAEQV